MSRKHQIYWTSFHFKVLSHKYLDIKPNLETASNRTENIAIITACVVTSQQPAKLHKRNRSWETLKKTVRLNPAQKSGRNQRGHYTSQ
jgi:hypothetical protein